MKTFSIGGFWRLFLSGIVVLFAVLFLGADYPEHELETPASVKIARELCEEAVPSLRGELKKAAAHDPVWLIRVIAE